MENSKYKIKIENGPVYEEQLAIVHIPSTLHSSDANHIITTSDEIYDMILKKRQSEINQEQELINQERKNLERDINEFHKKQGLINQEQDEFNAQQLAFNEAQRIINTEQKEFNERQKKINEEQAKLNEKQKNINEDVRLDIDSIKLEIVSAGGDINAIKSVLKNYITKSDFEDFEHKLEEIISDIYTKKEVDNLLKDINNEFNNHYTKTEIDEIVENVEVDLTDYYTKKEVDEAIENVEVDLTDYYTKEEVDDAIENAEVDLTGYYTKEEVDDRFLQLEIGEMLNNVSASMYCSPSSDFEKGTTVSHTITLNTNNFTLDDKTLLYSIIKKGNTILAESTGDTVSCSDTITDSTSYSGVVIYNRYLPDNIVTGISKTWSASCGRAAYYRTYYGFGHDVESVFIDGNNTITSSARGVYADTSKEDNVYYFIIVPSGVSVPSTFTMNATPFVMNKSTLTKNNISYTVFKSGSSFGIGGEVNINAQ
jgi:HEPN domain-containing protein